MKTKFNHNDRVFHALFGWCKIRMISEKLNLPVDFLLNWFNRNVGQVIA